MEKTETSFGIVHGDAHIDNVEMEEMPDGSYNVSLLDFDQAGHDYFIVDIGTIVWNANYMMFVDHRLDRIKRIDQFKEWILESYGWNTTEEELKQGCLWRREYMYATALGALATTPKEDPVHSSALKFVAAHRAGLIPSC